MNKIILLVVLLAFNETFARIVGLFVIFLEIGAVTTITFGLSNHLSTIIRLPYILISYM